MSLQELMEPNENNGLDIFTAGELVMVRFFEPVAVFSMTAQQAMAFAKAMTEAANYIALMGNTDGKVH